MKNILLILPIMCIVSCATKKTHTHRFKTEDVFNLKEEPKCVVCKVEFKKLKSKRTRKIKL